MGKDKSGWYYSKRIMAPYSLEGCELLLQQIQYPAPIQCTVIDGDNYQFAMTTSKAVLSGAMKRWESDSTLVLYKVQPRKLNKFLNRTAGDILGGAVVLGIAALLDDDVADFGDSNIGPFLLELDGWDGSMRKVDEIGGDEGALLRLMRDLFGDQDFEEDQKGDFI
jgi:hypothetical protein